MSYLNLLRELSRDRTVWLRSHPVGWSVEVSGHRLKPVTAYGDTPEQAIRIAYLAVFPVVKNTRSGKLTQTS